MIRTSPAQKMFQAFNYTFLTVLAVSMLLPFLHILAGSFSSGNAILQGKVTIFPAEFTWVNYKVVLNDITIWKSFGVTVFITIVGTALNLFFTTLMAYGLSKKDLKGRSLIVLFVLFTMIFQAPMIPSYLVVKNLFMLDTLWALMIPGLISAFNLFIMISFFQGIPDNLTDAAKIDGCGEYRTLWKVVLPLSLPSLTTIGLFYAVGHWNSYAGALMYIRNTDLYPLQLRLRKLIVESDAEGMLQAANVTLQSIEGIKMATIIVATIPILIIYPLIQKHFVKGAMLGSIKG
jgi:multiple sugar transport system permease protein/putative aldouronate transport system permease protein